VIASRSIASDPAPAVPAAEHRRGGRPDWLRFSFPTWWQYDVRRTLDYFRAAGDAPDPRLIRAWPRRSLWCARSSALTAPGYWRTPIPARCTSRMEDGDGLPSRWNTLRALRVLDGYDGSLR